MTESKQICGADLLRNPQLNRADAFPQEERDARGLRGLLPPAVSTMELQVKRTLALLDRCPTALDKFLMLDSLHATDEDLYFKILIDYIDDYMPVVYTPTVGEVCQKFSHIYRYPRGAFISINDKGRVREIIENCPNEEVDVIVVTAGQRILASATSVSTAWASPAASSRSTRPAPASPRKRRFPSPSTSARTTRNT